MLKYKLLILFFLSFLIGFAQDRRNLNPKDIYQIKEISDAKLSPEGKWILYTISTPDSLKDNMSSKLWMTSWDGKNTIQLTHQDENISNAQFSPEGKYISYLASAKVDSIESAQLWLMDRRGGEGYMLTQIKGDIENYSWSPDGTKILFQIKDSTVKPIGSAKTPFPYVINDYKFKQDVEGYLVGKKSHLYIYDISKKMLEQITTGNFSETNASWSPDCSKIAFVSNRSNDPDRNDNTDIYIIDAKPNSKIIKLTSWNGAENNPKFSPNGKFICYEQSVSDKNFINYDESTISIISTDGKIVKQLTSSLDRSCTNAEWKSDSENIYFLLEDDLKVNIGTVNINSGEIKRIALGDKIFGQIIYSPDGILTSISTTNSTKNFYVITNDNIYRQLTFVNDDFLNKINLAKVKSFKSKGADSVEVSGLLTSLSENKNQPLILLIHGGPVAQDQYQLDLEAQLLAASGFTVAQVNYRGSSGKGIEFSKAIYGDWGNKEVIDLLGATDYLVKSGIADVNKMGVGGWSYGGILTDYIIAKDTRFKAAVSGAGSALQISLYGVDMYMLQWNEEIGQPWNNFDIYKKISYPFLNANKIKTPTLFMVGEKDFNVPAVGSEQMYAALKTLNVPTQLVVYPNQFHSLSSLIYQIDKIEREINWFKKYIK